MSSISAISSVGNLNIGTNPIKSNEKVTNDFKSVLDEMINKANETDASDKAANVSLMTGNTDNLHDALIKAEEADLALRLTVQVRNKVLDAYTEIMRMQV